MNAATLLHPMTTLSRRAERSRRGPRTSLMGALVLALSFAVLAGSFLYDVARPVGAATVQAATGPLARSQGTP